MTSTNQRFTAKVLQEMIDSEYKAVHDRLETIYNTETPGDSPSDVSFKKTNEIYATLATPLKNMKAEAMKETAAKCFRDKWMDEGVPNPHQVEMCTERIKNKHMGFFYQNLVNLREANRYRYQDCLVDAGNNMEKAVFCVRGYLTGIDADNVTLRTQVEAKCAKYF